MRAAAIPVMIATIGILAKTRCVIYLLRLLTVTTVDQS